MATNKNKMDLYRVIATRLLIDNIKMREHEEQQVAQRVRAANTPAFVKDMGIRYVDTMVRARQRLIRDAIARASSETDLQRVIYFFVPSFGMAHNLHVMRSNGALLSANGSRRAELKLDWNKIWRSDPELMAAARKIKEGVKVALTNPERKIARKRLRREFNSMKNNFQITL